MRLKQLKNMMLIPDHEVLINRMVKLNHADVLLLAITSQQQTRRLWTLSKSPELYGEVVYNGEEEEGLSNRERMQQELRRENVDDQENYISQLIIQGQAMTFTSSESTCCAEHDRATWMKLQHFIEQGLELEAFAEVRLERLMLTYYEQDESESFPQLDLDKELDITLKFDSKFRRIPVQTEPIVLEFGDSQKDTKYSFYDSFHEKERFFYINGLTRYDLWEDAKRKFEEPAPEGMSEKDWKRLNVQYIENLESFYSREQDLALIEYESEDNIQLNFYAQDDLNAAPSATTSNTSIVMFFKSENEFGHHGLKSRTDMVIPVDKTFNGSLVIELMSYYAEIPEKKIKL